MNVPTSRNAKDARHIRRYPIRSTTGAPMAEPITTASIIGVRTRPASVADELQHHLHEQRQERDDREHHHAERHADHARGPQRGTRNRLKGISGSVARCSATTNATNSTTLVTKRRR